MTLPGGTDDAKREFLADVSSFANAAGGDIIYGVKEDEGIPTSINGLPAIDPDAEILRLDNSIRDGIEPRVPGVQIKAVDGFADGPVIILRVPKSWCSPHLVKFKNWSRFFSRTNAGKFQMDVTEIRSAFALSDTLPERIRRFRDDRLSKIISGETPIPLGSSGKTVLHLLPLSAFSSSSTVDVLAVAQGQFHLKPMLVSSWDGRMNLDGYFSYYQSEGQPCYSYTQLFHNGIIEAVDNFTLSGEHKLIPSSNFESNLVQILPQYLTLLSQLNIMPPVFIMLSLVGVKGFSLVPEYESVAFRNQHTIDRDIIVLPEVMIENLSQSSASILKPIFDTLWQSAGHLRSYNFDEQGNWVPRN